MAMRQLLLLAALPLTACATMSGTSAGPVAIDQTQRVGPFRVTPLEVKEDSRCPMNARCIWAGRVIVRANIDDGTGTLERNLTLGEPAEVGDRRVLLDSVTPERNAGTEAAVAAYRFHFSIAP